MVCNTNKDLYISFVNVSPLSITGFVYTQNTSSKCQNCQTSTKCTNALITIYTNNLQVNPFSDTVHINNKDDKLHTYCKGALHMTLIHPGSCWTSFTS